MPNPRDKFAWRPTLSQSLPGGDGNSKNWTVHKLKSSVIMYQINSTIHTQSLSHTVALNYFSYFFLYRQYAFSIKDEDAGEVLIALLQEDTRIDRDEGGKNLSIGYYIMKVTHANKLRTQYLPQSTRSGKAFNALLTGECSVTHTPLKKWKRKICMDNSEKIQNLPMDSNPRPSVQKILSSQMGFEPTYTVVGSNPICELRIFFCVLLSPHVSFYFIYLLWRQYSA